MGKKLIEINDLCKKYDDQVILDNLNLYINDQEFVTLLGPSGCGKTTTLRIIGGFESADSGDVLLSGEDIKSKPSHYRPINTVFQKYALFPEMNVSENIAFGLENSVHSKVYNLGCIALLEKNNFDDDFIKDMEDYLENYEEPKACKEAIIDYFNELSPTVNFINDLYEISSKNSYKDNAVRLLNEYKIESSIEIDEAKCSLKKYVKMLAQEQATKDVFLEMISEVGSRGFKKRVIDD